jgi:hypothetical protein
MKKIFLNLVMFVAIAGLSLSLVSWDQCPPYLGDGTITLLPNPDDCSTFYECDWGIPILIDCPDDLYFCDEMKLCTWDWEANCTFDCVFVDDGDDSDDSDDSFGSNPHTPQTCNNLGHIRYAKEGWEEHPFTANLSGKGKGKIILYFEWMGFPFEVPIYYDGEGDATLTLTMLVPVCKDNNYNCCERSWYKTKPKRVF